MTITQFQKPNGKDQSVIDGLGPQLNPLSLHSSRRHLLFSGIGFLGLGLMGCSPSKEPRPKAPSDMTIKGKMPSMLKHDPALSIENFSFLTPDQKTVKHSDFNGHFRLLNLWATWCAPCIVELPSLEALSQSALGQRLKVMVLSVDDEASRPKVLERIKTLPGLIAYHDPYFAAPKVLGPEGMPTTYLFNPEGELIAEWAGEADWHSNEMVSLLEGLIKT
jgi:thiol-disulfide isomerase/thioredoxin